MSSFIISYDLIAPNKDYTALYEAIKTYGTYSKVNESLWVINSNRSSIDILNYLSNYIDSNDRLFVAKLTGESAWINSLTSDAWLKMYL